MKCLNLKNKKGWITWTFGRIGTMIAVTTLILLTFMVYQNLNCINASDSANKVSGDLAKAMVNAYSGPVGVEYSLKLPSKVDNHPYSLTLINGNGKKGITIEVYGTRCGTSKGGTPLAINISNDRGILKNATEENITLILKNTDAGLKILKKDNCSDCIVIQEFHYGEIGDNDCLNPNNEYVVFKNKCDFSCNMTGWTLKDAEDRTPYIFKDILLDFDETVKVYSGDGTDNNTPPAKVYWDNQDFSCNAVWNNLDNNGDTLNLRHRDGYLILQYTYQ